MKRTICALTAILFAVSCLGLPAAAASDDGGFSVAHTERRCTASAAPGTSAGRGVLMDADTGALLWSLHPDSPGLIASTTKIMTAYLVCREGELERPVTIPAEAVGVEGSSLYLQEGETLTREELLLGTMLQSGNDAALALALDAAGSVEAFAERMNEAARDLGLQNTHYANPHGLDQEGNYGSARDLALLTAAALQNPDFRRITATKTAGVAGDRVLVNHPRLLRRCPGWIGGKTGYTKAAGRLLVSAAERGGRTLICVTINDPADWQDHLALYDWGFAQYRERTVAVRGEPLMRSGNTDLIARADLTLLLAPEAEPRLVYAPGFPDAGSVKIYLNGRLLAEVPVSWGTNRTP